MRSGASGILGQGRYGEPRVSEGCFEVSNGVRDSEEIISRAAKRTMQRGLRSERRALVLVGLEQGEKPGVGCWFFAFCFRSSKLAFVPLLFCETQTPSASLRIQWLATSSIKGSKGWVCLLYGDSSD